MGHTIQGAVEAPGCSFPGSGNPSICTDAVYVVHTSIDDTFAAVRVAGDFAKALGVPVTLVHVRTVHYALPLDEPGGISPVETEAFVTRLRAEGLDIRVRVYLCRDEHQAIPSAFKSHSLIVLAGRRSWLPNESARWRRMLESAGHFVVFVDNSERRAGGAPAEPVSQPRWRGHSQASSAVAATSGTGVLLEQNKERSHA
jgi:hypothetical protein